MTSRVSSKSSDRGIVYLLESEWQGKKVVKIGKTGPEKEDLRGRIDQLSSGVPGTLPCIHASLVNDARTVEKNLHTIFKQLRVPPGSRSEFFDVEPESAMVALEAYQRRDMTRFAKVLSNRDKKSIDSVVREKGGVPRATFAMLKIPVGKELTLVGNPAIVCEVADTGTQVLYKGRLWALSTLATALKRSSFGLQGIRHWKYEGQTLLQRRDKILERR